MKLFELEMELDEGPRQDRAIELFQQNLPIRQAEGDKAFRHKFIQTIMDEFGASLATAANLYNFARMKANLTDLGRTATRAAKGLPPVVRNQHVSNFSNNQNTAPANNQPKHSGTSNPEELIKDTDSHQNMTDEDDVEWERFIDDNVLELSWGLQYEGLTAEQAMHEYANEVRTANRHLEKLASKYRDRLNRLRPQTLEKAKQSDEVHGNQPSNDIQYLSGSVDFKI